MTPELANIFGFGNPWDIAIIAGVVVLLFGGAKVAGFGKNLGEGMKEFKRAVREGQEDQPDAVSTSLPQPPAKQVTAQPENIAAPAEPVGAAPAAQTTQKEQ